MFNRIHPQRFIELAKLTTELFPKTLQETWYVPSSKSKTAHGAFFNYYGKQREKEIAIGRLQSYSGLKRKLPEEGSYFLTNFYINSL